MIGRSSNGAVPSARIVGAAPRRGAGIVNLASGGGKAEEVDLELLLLVDVSRSMSPAELEIQRRGYAEALKSDAVATALGRTTRPTRWRCCRTPPSAPGRRRPLCPPPLWRVSGPAPPWGAPSFPPPSTFFFRKSLIQLNGPRLTGKNCLNCETRRFPVYGKTAVSRFFCFMQPPN